MNFYGERRGNQTHQSSTDPEARLARKGAGKEARLYYSGNALMENRNSILIDFQVEPADGFAERRAAIAMADERLPGTQRITLGADKGYDIRDLVGCCRALKITPHVAQNQTRAGGSALDARTARHPGYGPGTHHVNRDNEIIKNRIAHCGRTFWFAAGIHLEMVGDSLVSHNSIEDMPLAGILINGVTPIFVRVFRGAHEGYYAWGFRWDEIGDDPLTDDSCQRFVPDI